MVPPRFTKCKDRHLESVLFFKVYYRVALVRNVWADSKKAIISWIKTQRENYRLQCV